VPVVLSQVVSCSKPTALHSVQTATDPTGKVLCQIMAPQLFRGVALPFGPFPQHTSCSRRCFSHAVDRAAAAAKFATAAKSSTILELGAFGVFNSITASLAAKNASGREGGLLVIAALAGSVGGPAGPHLRPLLGQVQGMLADEAASVRAAAASAQVSLVQGMGVGFNWFLGSSGRACMVIMRCARQDLCVWLQLPPREV
jgi:hypothetical protein